MDICTVVFRDELDSLRLQAQSIQLYARDLNPRSIYVMVNDDSVVDTTIYGDLADRVRVIPRSTYGCEWSENGWLSQQVLKLYGVALSSATWCTVLDAKTLFVRPVLESEIMRDGRPRVGNLAIYPVFDKSRQLAEHLYGVHLDRQLGPGGVPFIFHTATTRAMIGDTEIMTGQHFADWFQSQGMLTEFILYSAYLHYQYHGFDHLYDPTNRVQCVNLCHSESDQFDRKFQIMQQDQTLTVSIHRDAWPRLTADQRRHYLDFLAARGIT